MRKYTTAALICAGALLQAQNIFTIAGIPHTHRNSVDSQLALSAPLGPVYGLLIDRNTGRLILNDESLVLRLEPDGTLLALVGAGPVFTRQPQLSGNGAPAGIPASFLNVRVLRGMAQDSAGAFYLSEAAAGRVYRVAPDGMVTIFAGGGTEAPGFESDGGPATAAILQSPRGLVFDSHGNLDIAEVSCNCIRQVSPDGIISTLYTLPRPPAPNSIPNVEGLAIDSEDNLYVTEWLGNVVIKLAADGSSATTIAGAGTPGFDGDGGSGRDARLNGPSGVALDGAGNVYIADTKNHRIRRVATDGTIDTFAGTGTCGFSGDGGPASIAQLCQPAQIVFDISGSMLISDYGNRRVRKISPDGTIRTIAGSGKSDPRLSNRRSEGDGGPEIHATFDLIGGAVFDSAGTLFVSESLGNVIRKITLTGDVSTFAGTGKRASSGDGGPATQADLFSPGPLSIGPDGSLYVITGDSRIRKITRDGNISLVAGTGTGAGLIRSQGDGGPAVNATLNEPGGLAFDQQGNIYIADTSNARVRKIDRSGTISTVAGPGQQGVDYYNAVAVDPRGNLYVAWTHAAPPSIYATVNRVNPDGSLTTVAGNGQPCSGGPAQFTGDGSRAINARLCAVVGLAVDRNGLLNLSEGVYSLVLRLNADGTIQRIAGNTKAVHIGDGGPVLEAGLASDGRGFSPEVVTFDPAGNLHIAQPGPDLIRKVTPTPYKLAISPDHVNASGSLAQSLTLIVSGNFDEPFPYSVAVRTSGGVSWLTANRVTGFTGEPIRLRIDPARIAPGSYHGTVTVTVLVPVGGGSRTLDIPVSLTIP